MTAGREGNRLEILRRLMTHRLGAVGLICCVGVIVIALAAQWISPYDPEAMSSGPPLVGPNTSHWFGTDELGRDILSRVLYGTRIALIVGLAVALISALVGVPLGLISGYYGGWVDSVLMRIVDAWQAFPMMVLALGITAALGAGLTNVSLAIGFATIPNFIRLARGQAMMLNERAYVEAARSMGQSDTRIVSHYLLPNMISVLIVQASLTVAYAVLVESALSFLGVGIMPPTPSWGGMLSSAQGFLSMAPWMAIAPGSAIFVLVMGLNLLGDGLRDTLDPQLRQ